VASRSRSSSSFRSGSTTRRTSSTAYRGDAGKRFYAESVGILGSVERAGATTADGGNAISGRLVLSVAISVGLEVIVPRLIKFIAAHRSLQLELRLEDRSVDLISEGVDVAVRAGIPPRDSTGYIAHVLGEASWRVAVASPSYLRRRGKPSAVRQLARHDCLVHLGPSGPNRRVAFQRGDEIADVELHGPAESNAALALSQFALAGLGIAVCPEWLIDADLREGQLWRLLPGWRNRPSYTYAFHRVELRGATHVRALIPALGVRVAPEGEPPRAQLAVRLGRATKERRVSGAAPAESRGVIGCPSSVGERGPAEDSGDLARGHLGFSDALGLHRKQPVDE
jgi:DNA-binding transcriptional LysR family regulator